MNVDIGKGLTDEQIASATQEVVRESFYRYFVGRKKVKTKHPLLSEMFPHEYMTRSVIGSLETSLGTGLWENLAKSLAELNGFQVLDEKSTLKKPKDIPAEVEGVISSFARRREDRDLAATIDAYVVELQKVVSKSVVKDFVKLSKGTGVDLFLRKGNDEYAIDIKTVQINAGGGDKFNRLLMDWIAFYRLQFGYEYNFHPKIVIPYVPQQDRDWWADFGTRISPLQRSEVLVADDFWNLLSGRSGTSTLILTALRDFSTSEFADFYRTILFRWGSDVDIELIQLHFNVQFLGSIEKASNRKKLRWRCNCCGEEFDARIGQVRDANLGCIYTQLTK
jgi:hypothetical protein